MKLEVARKIADAALAEARKLNLKSMGVAVLDARGAIRVMLCEDDNSTKRCEIAQGKCNAALALGVGSRGVEERAKLRPYFAAALPTATNEAFLPITGAVLIKEAGKVIGVVGLSGDTSDNDEACALAGIAAVGLDAQPGD